MIIFRMHGTTYPVFDTTGAFFHPGRWHSAGTRVVYAAQNASLAVLETLIHAGGRKLPPRVLTRIDVADDLFVESVPWIDMPRSQQFGDLWVREGRSAVLRVPSISVNGIESNFILNPGHADFARIGHDKAQEFRFDPRFFPSR